MKKLLYGIAIIIIVVIGIYLFNDKNSDDDNTNQNQTTQDNSPMEINVVYSKGQAFTPQTYKVDQGKKVVIKVTSDIADEVHFHGYDLHTDLEIGKQGTIEFNADKTGRFEFELEDNKIVLGIVEVYPK